MGKIKQIMKNKWVKFALVSVIYILLTVVWTGNLWMLLGLVVIYDIYISKYMYRWFWAKHKERKKASRRYREIWGWVEAIVFAVVVTTLARFFLFGMYVIPTPSMEKTLLVGDYLWVSKLAYGPVVPNTPISFPMVHNTMPLSETKKSYVEWVKWPYHRLKGFGSVRRGDVVVFNFPAGDTVLLENQAVTYYDVLHEYQREYGEKEGRRILNQRFTVAARPVDKRENYVKRCVGIPGDTITIRGSLLTVNGQSIGELPDLQYMYFVRTNGTPISKTTFEQLGVSGPDIRYNTLTSTYTIPLTGNMVERVRALGNVTDVVQYVAEGYENHIFPQDTVYRWNQDNFGPLWVPSRGSTVTVTAQNVPLYRDIIEKYEGNELRVANGRVYINGKPTESYTFKMNYYFMMGDNRHASSDSRYWGFVPEDHIVGKASFIWFSSNQEKGFPSNIRWRRIGRKIR